MSADALERLDLLGGDAQFDLCARSGRPSPDGDGSATGMVAAERRYRHGDIRRHITNVQGRDGAMPVLKVLQTNACAKDCFYCPFRAGRTFRREAFTPDELARLVDQLHRARLIRGLFLSSGVVGHDDYSMEKITATAELLRGRYGFKGYLHLKIMPAASDGAIERAVQLADRVSINLEAPNAERLARLSTTKDHGADLLAPLRRVRALATAQMAQMTRQGSRWVSGDSVRGQSPVSSVAVRNGQGTPAIRLGQPGLPSSTTQFVVGAAGESDAEILATTDLLYRELGLARVYYSAFRPIPDTPLDGLPSEDPERERRLYQADFLIRDYGFEASEMGLDDAGRLPLHQDPKLALARAHPERYPVDIARADRDTLLRVPGIGPRGLRAIVAARREGTLRDESDLRRLGIQAGRVLPWVTIGGRRPAVQLGLEGV